MMTWHDKSWNGVNLHNQFTYGGILGATFHVGGVTPVVWISVQPMFVFFSPAGAALTLALTGMCSECEGTVTKSSQTLSWSLVSSQCTDQSIASPPTSGPVDRPVDRPVNRPVCQALFPAHSSGTPGVRPALSPAHLKPASTGHLRAQLCPQHISKVASPARVRHRAPVSNRSPTVCRNSLSTLAPPSLSMV
jgi:hypothetical protein